MAINKYKMILDENGYIEGFYTVEEDYDYEGQMSQFPDACDGWTKCVNGELIVDEEKKQEILENIAKNTEISELEHNLDSTDYIMARMLEEIMALNNPLTFIADMIKIFANYASKYKDTLADRKAWRARIEELKG